MLGQQRSCSRPWDLVRTLGQPLAAEGALSPSEPPIRTQDCAPHPGSEGGFCGAGGANVAECSRRSWVTSGPASCSQMSTSAARRTEAAAKYATTSRAASSVPATGATRSPQTVGPATVSLTRDPRPLSSPVRLCSCQKSAGRGLGRLAPLREAEVAAGSVVQEGGQEGVLQTRHMPRLVHGHEPQSRDTG